jgi:hypothetical protein
MLTLSSSTNEVRAIVNPEGDHDSEGNRKLLQRY